MVKMLILALLVPAVAFGQLELPEGPVRMLALGDSYTIGQSVSNSARWPVQLGDSLEVRGYNMDTVRIIATTGWRTDNLLNAIKGKRLEELNYNLVSVLIGVNNQYQGRPFIQYAGEFPALLDSAVRYAGGHREHVFVVSIPDYAYTPFGQQSSNPSQISIELDQYNAYSRGVADSMHIAFFDITSISRLGLQQPLLVAGDGLHPSGLQYTAWVKLMLAYIDQESISNSAADTDVLPGVMIRPNPTSGSFALMIPETYLQQSSCTLQIYDLSGILLNERLISQESTALSLAAYPDGCYIAKVSCGDKSSIRKIIKQ